MGDTTKAPRKRDEGAAATPDDPGPFIRLRGLRRVRGGHRMVEYLIPESVASPYLTHTRTEDTFGRSMAQMENAFHRDKQAG